MPYSVTTTIVKYKRYKNLTQGKLKKCLNKAQNDVNSGYLCFKHRRIVLETRQTEDQSGLSNLYVLENAENYVLLAWCPCWLHKLQAAVLTNASTWDLQHWMEDALNKAQDHLDLWWPWTCYCPCIQWNYVLTPLTPQLKGLCWVSYWLWCRLLDEKLSSDSFVADLISQKPWVKESPLSKLKRILLLYMAFQRRHVQELRTPAEQHCFLLFLFSQVMCWWWNYVFHFL